MTQKVRELLIDDLDGGEAAETVRFSLDGEEYQIDLSARHAEALRAALRPYTAAARRLGRARRSSRSTAASRATMSLAPYESRAVRAWAAANGITLASRGRIPNTVIERYLAHAGR